MPEFVAKLYHSPPDARRAKKLAHMVRVYTSELDKVAAWPRATLHSKGGGDLCGFVMPRMTNHKELHVLYGPKSRYKEFPSATWAFLAHVAMNCAAAFDSVHEKGAVIGDVNARNILVSAQAMVRLIDCDSFQIVAGAEQYLSEVGVPEYTPPELQGARFDSTVRSTNHDCFGLAVVIFHLLFMGRHPFFGAFTGGGDMPMDRAIKEFRFVYGAEGFKKQMRAPPFSLPLHFVTPEIGNLFELAFSRQGSRADRPSAARWMRALGDMTRGLRTCSTDASHKFPATAQSCAWCEIAAQGGPTFFYSADMPVTFECSPADLDETLAQYQRLEMEELSPPSPAPIPELKPQPLPGEVVASKLPWPFSTVAFVVSCLVAAISGGVTIGAPTPVASGGLAFGLCLSGVILLWRAWFVNRSLFGRERTRRVQLLHAARGELVEATFAQAAIERSWRSRLANTKARALAIRQAYAQLKPAYDAEAHQAERNAEAAQRETFLESFELRGATISNIGEGRKASLRSYGFETAKDILERDPAIVPGIGDSLARSLRSWAQGLERRFRFDPKKGLPASQRQALVGRFRNQKASMFAMLQTLLDENRRAATDTREQQKVLTARLQNAIERETQAQLDVSLTGNPSRAVMPLTFAISLILLVVFASSRESNETRSAQREQPVPISPSAAPTATSMVAQPAEAPAPKRVAKKKWVKRSVKAASASSPTGPIDPYEGSALELGSTSPDVPTSTEPETLSAAMIEEGLAALGPQLDSCFDASPMPGELRFSLTVRPDGKVASVSVLHALSTSLSLCVSGVLRSATFTPTQAGAGFVRSISLPR
jgi:DNA-binding helix-hairpin-helix protein with protein kinase domain